MSSACNDVDIPVVAFSVRRDTWNAMGEMCYFVGIEAADTECV